MKEDSRWNGQHQKRGNKENAQGNKLGETHMFFAICMTHVKKPNTLEIDQERGVGKGREREKRWWWCREVESCRQGERTNNLAVGRTIPNKSNTQHKNRRTQTQKAKQQRENAKKEREKNLGAHGFAMPVGLKNKGYRKCVFKTDKERTSPSELSYPVLWPQQHLALHAQSATFQCCVHQLLSNQAHHSYEC